MQSVRGANVVMGHDAECTNWIAANRDPNAETRERKGRRSGRRARWELVGMTSIKSETPGPGRSLHMEPPPPMSAIASGHDYEVIALRTNPYDQVADWHEPLRGAKTAAGHLTARARRSNGTICFHGAILIRPGSRKSRSLIRLPTSPRWSGLTIWRFQTIRRHNTSHT